jgi:Fic family protein
MTQNITTNFSKNLEIFLQESNAIEDVWDDESYLQALQAFHCLDKATRLTPNWIKSVHSALMVGKVDDKYRGAWRDCPVWIGGHEAIPFYCIDDRVEEWCEWVQNLHKAKDINFAHVQFERIHPFIDGNGRVGRILWQWLRLKNKLPLKIIYEEKKWAYYKWFENN